MTTSRVVRLLKPLVVALALSACPDQPSSELSELTSVGAGELELVGARDGAPVTFPSRSKILLHYDPSLGAIRTEAFGNLYTIPVSASDDGSLVWGGIEGTLIAVPDALAKAAVRYTDLVIATRRVEKRPDGLALLSRDGTKALEYRYAPKP